MNDNTLWLGTTIKQIKLGGIIQSQTAVMTSAIYDKCIGSVGRYIKILLSDSNGVQCIHNIFIYKDFFLLYHNDVEYC